MTQAVRESRVEAEPKLAGRPARFRLRREPSHPTQTREGGTEVTVCQYFGEGGWARESQQPE